MHQHVLAQGYIHAVAGTITRLHPMLVTRPADMLWNPTGCLVRQTWLQNADLDGGLQVRPPVDHHFGCGPLQPGERPPGISIFRHRLLHHFSLTLFCKLPVEPLITREDTRYNLMVWLNVAMRTSYPHPLKVPACRLARAERVSSVVSPMEDQDRLVNLDGRDTLRLIVLLASSQISILRHAAPHSTCMTGWS